MLKIDLPKQKIAALCEEWKITELAVFGSMLHEDFGTDSDIDLLVTFAKDSGVTMFDLVYLRDAFAEVFGRSVDLVEKRAIKNPYRQKTILNNYEVIYETCRA